MAFTHANLCYQPVASVTHNAVDTGAIFDGVTVSWNATYLRETNDNVPGPVINALMNREYEITWNAHEAQQTNLAMSMGLPASAVSGGTLNLTNAQAAAASLVITGVAGTGPSNKVRTWTFTQASPDGTGSITIGKNGTARPSMKFVGLYDNSTSKYGTVVDV